MKKKRTRKMADILGDLERLEKLSLVSKVCTELENHLGVNDKDLAEFIIDLAEKNPSFEKFKKALLEASGEPFPDSFIANLLRIIQRMNPSMRQPAQQQASTSADIDLHKLTEITGPTSGTNFKPLDVDIKKVLCPALALPNGARAASDQSSSEDESDKKKRKEKEDKKVKVEKVEVKSEKKEPHSSSSSSSKSAKKAKKRSKSRSRSRSRSRNRRNRRYVCK